MHFVVVLRRPESAEVAAETLARCAGVTGSEARMRMAGELPRIAAVLAHEPDAAALAQTLCANGFAAGVLAASRVEGDADRDLVREIAFDDTALEVGLGAGRTRSVPYAQIRLALHGTSTTHATTTTEHTSKSFSASRALLSGGLITRKTTTSTETSTSTEAQGFLYLYTSDGEPTLALYERRTNYAGLGAKRAQSSRANFMLVVEEIRRRAAHARVDGRMIRPIGLGALPLPPAGRNAATWKLDVAVALLETALG